MKKLLMTSLLLVSASAWAACVVEYVPLKKASISVNGVDGEKTVLPCGKSGMIYIARDNSVYAACHTGKKHAKWVVYEKTDGIRAKGTDCHLIKNKGWACNNWQSVDFVSVEATTDYSRCTESEYDEASVTR